MVGIPTYSDGSGVGSNTGSGVPQCSHDAGQISSGSVVIVLCTKVKEDLPMQSLHTSRRLKSASLQLRITEALSSEMRLKQSHVTACENEP